MLIQIPITGNTEDKIKSSIITYLNDRGIKYDEIRYMGEISDIINMEIGKFKTVMMKHYTVIYNKDIVKIFYYNIKDNILYRYSDRSEEELNDELKKYTEVIRETVINSNEVCNKSELLNLLNEYVELSEKRYNYIKNINDEESYTNEV